MENKYRSSNIRFNMEDPIQAQAWNILQSQKGTKSYGKIISQALTLDSNQKIIEISEKSAQLIAGNILNMLAKNGYVLEQEENSANFHNNSMYNESNNYNENYFSSDMAEFAFE